MPHATATATAIRGATDSETIDLAGHSVENITQTMKDAFSEPLPLSEMIRITFITGAGKLGRQKYDEGAPKAVTSTLRELGFEEDRGASCVVECGGSFKSQHDTGKNLKTIVVFPEISGAGGGLNGGMAGLSVDDAAAAQDGATSLLPPGTPEHMVAASSMGVFERNWKPKCAAWSQKRGCLRALESVREMLDELDQKLLQGTPLSDPEQDLYDAVSADDLQKKEVIVKKEMATQVEAGKLTKEEKAILLGQVADKIETLKGEVDEAVREGKSKKAAKLVAMRDKAVARQEMLEKITPVASHKLKHEPEIQKLRAEMRPLQKLEDAAKGRLLSVKETTQLGRKDEILAEIEELEEASRGWFEEDDAFNARVEHWRSVAKGRESKKSGSGKKASGGGAGGGAGGGGGFKTAGKPKYILPGQKKTGWAKPAAAKKKPTGGSVFSAMMMDDSDSD
eukprot:CAMPEP_0181027346 /NCGR_PEP_ID=MMETSP1070-20121207/4118_1 /TAXON_ID=265543 /ORGANISM="Minutocellus polymorphus, Strain NH13" /LENGTH=451 /DNA_ID=CAMNT_0023104587 /DNA_START=61 /DNA_END=1416 /DNA_ORIENTATION=+